MTIDVQELARLGRELAQPLPHPDPAGLHDLTRQTADWVARHWATLPEQTLGRTASRPQMEALLRRPPPEEGRPFADVLADFEQNIASHALRVNHPRFLAFVPGAPCLPAVLGDWLCAGTNFFAGVWLEAAGPTQVEILVLDWFKEFLGYPDSARGVLTGGGSEANLTALAVAREPLSYEDRCRAVLFVTEHRHWSIDRAAKVLGFRPDQLQPLPATADFRLDPRRLANEVNAARQAGRLPWAVVANAGATNTGTVDPLAVVAAVCRDLGLWLHVDGAYGWPAVLTAEGRQLLAGIDCADSIALDPHKWFAQTFEAGCVLVRDGRRLTDTFALRPDYMQDVAPEEDEVNFADHGIALTRRFRALKIWLSVQMLGLSWFRRLVEHCCRLAEYAEGRLRHSNVFEVLNERQLSIVAFRYAPPELRGDDSALDRLNLALVEALLKTGRAFVSSTKLRGRVALRFCFVNWRTTSEHVDEIVELLARIGDSIRLQYQSISTT
jgi:glutamate/tyrosine decarboxylase-like PLP-dependent enzyme